MDGIRGVWEGGPFGKNPEWLWDYNALLFATDPVAMDHVEWDILDAQRELMKVPGVGAVGRLAADPFKHEGYDIRQPQYIAVAGQARPGKLRLQVPDRPAVLDRSPRVDDLLMSHGPRSVVGGRRVGPRPLRCGPHRRA